MHPYYRETYGYAPQDLPVAAGLWPELVTLPLYPDMTEPEAEYVCDSVRDIVRANRRGKVGPRTNGELLKGTRAPEVRPAKAP